MKRKLPEIRFLENSLLIDNEILVFGDVHVGLDESEGNGVFPRVQFKEIVKGLDRIFKLLDNEGVIVKQVVILGDLKQEFGGILDLEWSESLKLLDYLDGKIENGCEDGEDVDEDVKKDRIILIKGNHDNILEPIAKKRDLKVRDYYCLNGVCFMHGDKMFEDEVFEQCLANVDVLVMGHLHPAINISDNYKREKYKCFLKGKWMSKVVYVLFSFNFISFGYDLNEVGNNVGIWNKDKKNKRFEFIINDRFLKNFEVIIYNEKDDGILIFGKLKKLIKKIEV